MSFQYKATYEPNTFYHLYNRGNRKGLIFFCEADYNMFLSLMDRFSNDYNLIVYSYCLMPNHFHILLNSGSNPSEITAFMHRFMTSYAYYLNHKYDFVGRVFQSSYQYTVIYTEESYRRVIKYFDNNPVKAGLVGNPLHYKWLKHSLIF